MLPTPKYHPVILNQLIGLENRKLLIPYYDWFSILKHPEIVLPVNLLPQSILLTWMTDERKMYTLLFWFRKFGCWLLQILLHLCKLHMTLTLYLLWINLYFQSKIYNPCGPEAGSYTFCFWAMWMHTTLSMCTNKGQPVSITIYSSKQRNVYEIIL